MENKKEKTPFDLALDLAEKHFNEIIKLEREKTKLNQRIWELEIQLKYAELDTKEGNEITNFIESELAEI